MPEGSKEALLMVGCIVSKISTFQMDHLCFRIGVLDSEVSVDQGPDIV